MFSIAFRPARLHSALGTQCRIGEIVMRIILRHLGAAALFTAFALLGPDSASGLGHDFFTNKVASMPGYVVYPKGFEELVNATNRIAGYDVNAEMVFFFSGTAQDFRSFLDTYSMIPVADEHRLVLHDGLGEARSPWAKTGQPCDWKLYSAPKGWLEAHRLLMQGTNSLAAVQAAAKDHANYVVVVHFWTGGRIPLNQIQIPSNVRITR